MCTSLAFYSLVPRVHGLLRSRRVRQNIATVSLVALASLSSAAHGQGGCPAANPDQDYNCPLGPVYVLPNWGNVPWLHPSHFETIQTGDLDGDGVDELIGRDATGVHVFMYNAALGVWRPVLTLQGGAELILRDFSDARGWNSEDRYQTIRLVQLEAASSLKLVARDATGLVVYSFTRGADTSFGFPTGSWRQLASQGPFSDASGWNVKPYYQTLRYGHIDASGTVVVVGWGSNGLATQQWTGSGWKPLTDTAVPFGDAKDNPGPMISSQLAGIDGSVARFVVIGNNGIAAYRYVTDAGWQLMASSTQPLLTPDVCDAGSLTCAYTLRPLALDKSGIPVMVARASGCGTPVSGMVGVRWSTSQIGWEGVFNTGTFGHGVFDDCKPNDFHDPRNFRSIRAADVNGDGIDELIGRGPKGILAYRWNNQSESWQQIVNNTPALSDTLWASDPAYWGTILTATIDGKRSALLARGNAGVRTWLYNGSTFARPQPYGGFPKLNASYYAAINNLLKLPNGVRAMYTDDSTSMDLTNTSSALMKDARCQNLISVDPPQYDVCLAPLPLGPAATGVHAFTATVNQLLNELWYVAASKEYFEQVARTQSTWFGQESALLPAIDQLLLSSVGDNSAAANYLGLFINLLTLAAEIGGDNAIVLEITADALNVGLSINSLFQQSQTATLQQRYEQIRQNIVNLQETAQNDVGQGKVHVGGDYALARVLGRLKGSDIWQYDEDGYLNLWRYGFSTWVVQTLLPTIWDSFHVTGCGFYPGIECFPPPLGPNIGFYENTADGADFIGIFPKQNVCETIGHQRQCSWDALTDAQQNIVNFVFTPLANRCRYTPGNVSAWIYPGSTWNADTDCSLGVGPEIFQNKGGWKFNVVPLDFTE